MEELLIFFQFFFRPEKNLKFALTNKCNVSRSEVHLLKCHEVKRLGTSALYQFIVNSLIWRVAFTATIYYTKVGGGSHKSKLQAGLQKQF